MSGLVHPEGVRPKRPRIGRIFALAMFVLCLRITMYAQVFDPLPYSVSQREPKPLQIGSVTVTGELHGRGQGWNWFVGDTRALYAFGSSTLTLALSQQRSKFGWRVEVEQPTLFNLPNDAFVPGTNFPLGNGAIYYSANRNTRNPASIFLKEGFVSIRGVDRNHSTLRIGRFGFTEGEEKPPVSSDLAWLIRQRVAHRLIGDSYWTDIGRSFDGVHFSSDITEYTNLTFMAGRATKGVWQTNGMRDMDVDVMYGAYTREFPTPRTAGELRVFAMGYHDGRGVLKVDNRPLLARELDTQNIRIGTFGVNYALVAPIRYVGKWDLLVWGAQQIGHWGVLKQWANSATFELGWRPPIPWIHPWLRAGAFFASGDANPNDGQHTTFFQPLPTENQYARMPFYTLQNTEDYTGQLILQPTRKLLVRSEIHKVKLHAANDVWYLGSGAFQNTTFGYIGLPDNGHRGLGNYVDFSAQYQATEHWAVQYYIGAMSGKGAETVRATGRKGGFTYLEVAYRF